MFPLSNSAKYFSSQQYSHEIDLIRLKGLFVLNILLKVFIDEFLLLSFTLFVRHLLAEINSLSIIRYFSYFPWKNPLICPACFSMAKELIHGINEVYEKIRYFDELTIEKSAILANSIYH